MFDVFFFTDIKMPFTEREMMPCVLEYAQSQSNKTAQHAFMRKFSKQSPIAMQIWIWHKKYRGRLLVQEKRVWTTNNIRREGQTCS